MLMGRSGAERDEGEHGEGMLGLAEWGFAAAMMWLTVAMLAVLRQTGSAHLTWLEVLAPAWIPFVLLLGYLAFDLAVDVVRPRLRAIVRGLR